MAKKGVKSTKEVRAAKEVNDTTGSGPGTGLAIFPGSFDPVTNGHLDVIVRARAVFPKLIVAVLHNPGKATLFSTSERVDLILKSLGDRTDGIEVTSFDGLLVDYCRSVGGRVIIRGLRAVSDYDYETQMALMNRSLAPEIETFFLVTREENSYLSSSLVKQVAAFGGDVSRLVAPEVVKEVRKRFGR